MRAELLPGKFVLAWENSAFCINREIKCNWRSGGSNASPIVGSVVD